jgi:PKD repeat protein
VTYSDVASKLTPNSYSGLTFAAADLGFGASNFYAIHHTPSNVDYWAEIVPGTGTASSIADLKPMSWQGPTAGTPASPGSNGYFALTWATGILSAGAPYADQSIYYLRTNASNHTIFGVMIPALTGASSDTLDLTTAVGSFGVGGYTTLAFVPTSVIGNFPTNNFYYLRTDPVTGNSVLGRLNPSLVAGARTISDIANLGGLFNTLNFAFDATGPAGAWGTVQFYATGSSAPGAQSISFEAIPDHNIGDVFNVMPTASSGLDIDVTVVSGPATIAQTGVSGATPTSLRIFTVTTTGPGIVTLQARQAGQTAAPAFTANMLQQSFNVLGFPSITSANSAPGTVGAAFTFSVTATGSPTSYAATALPAGLVFNTATGAITGTPTAAGVTVVTLTATNATGTSLGSTLTITVAAAGVAPIITGPIAAPGTVGTAFVYDIAATGSPTGYTASPLPAGLAVNAATGAITGIPTAAAVTIVTLTATNGAGTSLPVTLTITVAAAGGAPVITSPLTAPGTVGTPFVTYTIAATNSPTSFTAAGLPAGLTLNLATGAINGTPTAAGVSVVALGATNATGTGTSTLTITVAAAGVTPIITSPTSANVPGTVGTTLVTYPITATGLPTSYSATGLPPGLTLNTLTGAITGTPTAVGTYTVTIGATNSTGTGTATVVFAISAAAVAPIITIPTNPTGTVGTPIVTYPITATGLPTSYTATGLPPGLSLNPLTGEINGTPTTPGTYTVTITATNGSGTSTVTITWVIAPFGYSHIVNFSARAMSGPGSDTLIVGFVVSGDGKNLLVRGIGPGLAAFGIANFLPDPILTLFNIDGTVEATDSGWQVNSAGLNDGALIASTAASVGAFPLASGSMDSALLVTVDNGVHTTGLLTTNGASGVGLIEIYDTGGNPYASLTNVSARMEVTGGNGILIAGLVIGGNGPKTVLIRGVGPTLSQFGVTGALADPVITVFSGTSAIASNSSWGTGTSTAAQIASASAGVGAFPLSSGSKDAALLTTLNPGAYTVEVTSASSANGVALIEVYDTQP